MTRDESLRDMVRRIWADLMENGDNPELLIKKIKTARKIGISPHYNCHKCAGPVAYCVSPYSGGTCILCGETVTLAEMVNTLRGAL